MGENYGNRTRNEAIEKIESYIIKNKLAPHEKIPSERDLCEMWDFNRTTLRSAIQHLIIEGKLYRIRICLTQLNIIHVVSPI